MKKTERIIEYFISKGAKEVLPSKSRKYRQFTSLLGKTFIWIGKAGAVRVGKTSSNSISITHKFNKF